jgi:hypothetical protein
MLLDQTQNDRALHRIKTRSFPRASWQVSQLLLRWGLVGIGVLARWGLYMVD